MAITSRADRVGFIGLGAMGLPMARNAVAAGAPVGLTGRSPAKAASLVEAGAVWHDSPRSLAAQSDVIVLMLPDLPEVETVLDGPDGILAASPRDLVLVISSTSSPDGVRALNRRLAERTAAAVRVIDAPVSGGTDGAAAGTLSIMVGGADGDVRRALPLLRACGTPVHLGPLGAGQVAKACNQMIVASTILALGEAAVLADRSGLDLTVLFDLLAGGYAGSRILATRGQRLVTEDYSPSGPARYMAKDLDFAASVAAETNSHPMLLPAVREAFQELVARGLGDFDIAVTRRFIDQR
ncbi:MAG TPA: NAD(P)-dependent oxidoreductase [Pseudonocardia sp.]|nr:NAD(P)-dependent oxidoreductase [Pseudonocardia sp.]